MSSRHAAAGALESVLIVAPYRRDAEYLASLLCEHDMHVALCSGECDLERNLSAEPGVLVMTHEAITPPVMQVVRTHLLTQPAWAELPIVVMLDRRSLNARVKAELARQWPNSRQLYYQRPLTSVEIVSGVQSALLARHRQRDLRDHIDREVELRRELNHRVKNILASVVSIFEMTRRTATSLDVFADDFRGRLSALAQVHSAVFKNEGEVIAIGDVAGLTFQPYAHEVSRIGVSGPQVLLTAEAGTTLALCLHELATNAIKYGALSTSEGRVDFAWALTGVGEAVTLHLRWIESGGPLVTKPDKPGYGTRYVRSALTSLLGRPPTFSFLPDGLHVHAQGPLSRLVPTAKVQDPV